MHNAAHYSSEFVVEHYDRGERLAHRVCDGIVGLVDEAHRLKSKDSRLAADLLGGTAEFEAWFRSDGVGGKNRDGLRHAPFRSGTLRGLEYSGDKMRGIVEVPEKVVLRTEYNRKEGDEAIWDARLAVDLVRECLKGEASDVYGYCSLLARGVPFGAEDVPPPTAPDAIRHWTASQKARLKSSSRGEKLLRKEKSQTKEWSQKYASLPPEDRAAISEGQFLWAMEAVNSRAFKGNYGGGLLNQLQRLTLHENQVINFLNPKP